VTILLQVALTMKTPKPKQWAEQEVRRLVTLARKGVGTSRIAAELGRHAGSVRRMARTLGLLLKK
jgi:IS30 family transposase